MALSTAEKLTFRTYWIYDNYDGTESPIIALSDYNRVHRANFVTNDQLDDLYDQIVAEDPQFYQAFTDVTGTPQSALSTDATTAIYRAMRKRVFQQMLLSSAFIKSIYAAASSEQVVDRIVQNMKDAMTDDSYSKVTNSQNSGSVSLQRG